jgi:hypothetical protein
VLDSAAGHLLIGRRGCRPIAFVTSAIGATMKLAVIQQGKVAMIFSRRLSWTL